MMEGPPSRGIVSALAMIGATGTERGVLYSPKLGSVKIAAGEGKGASVVKGVEETMAEVEAEMWKVGGEVTFP